MARIVAYATSGLAPKYVMMTPVEAVRKVLAKTGWSVADVDLVELNEAFAAQAVAVTRELGLDPLRVNVQGGAVALGHPIGASGARVLTTLLYALRRTGGRRGIATLCLGGGNGVALAVETSSRLAASTVRPSSVPAPWAPASRRSSRRPATPCCCTTFSRPRSIARAAASRSRSASSSRRAS